MEDVGEGDEGEEVGEEFGIVDVAVDDEDGVFEEEGLPGPFEGGGVVGVEVVEAQDAVAAAFEGEGAVGADKSAGAGDEDGEAGGAAGGGGLSDLFLPGGGEGGGEELAVVVGLGGGGEGEEEEEEERNEEGGAEEEGGGGGKELGGVDAAEVRVVALKLGGFTSVWWERRSHEEKKMKNVM